MTDGAGSRSWQIVQGKRMTLTETIEGISGQVHFCADDEKWYVERAGQRLAGPFETLTQAETLLLPSRRR